MSKYLYFIPIFFMLFSCDKYENKYSNTELPDNQYFDLAYMHNDSIYLSNRFFTNIKLIPSLDEDKKSMEITFSKDKIAYLNDQNIPVIIDTAGNEIARLSQYANTKDLGWSHDGQSLYLLINNQLVIWGNPMILNSTPLVIFPANAQMQQIDAISIDKFGAVFSAFRYYVPGNFQPYVSGYTIRRVNDNNSLEESTKSSDYTYKIVDVHPSTWENVTGEKNEFNAVVEYTPQIREYMSYTCNYLYCNEYPAYTDDATNTCWFKTEKGTESFNIRGFNNMLRIETNNDGFYYHYLPETLDGRCVEVLWFY